MRARRKGIVDTRVRERLRPAPPVRAGAELETCLEAAGLFYMGVVEGMRQQLRELGISDVDAEAVTLKAAAEIKRQLAHRKFSLDRLDLVRHVEEIRASEALGVRQVVTRRRSAKTSQKATGQRPVQEDPSLRMRRHRLEQRRKRSSA